MRRARLRSRLLLLVALAVIPAFALIVHSALEQRRAAVADALQDALRLAERVADTEQDAFEAARHLLTALAQLPEVRARDGATCSRALAEIAKGFPRYTSLIAVAPDGVVFCSATPVPERLSFAATPLFERARQGRFVIGHQKHGSVSGKPIVILSQAAHDGAGRIVAHVFAGVELAWLTDRLRESVLPHDTTVRVIDESATQLLRFPDSAGAVGENVGGLESVRIALGAGRGTARAGGRDGGARLVGFTSFGPPGERIFVIASAPEAVALAASSRELARNLGVLVAVGLTVFAIAWFGADFLILRPLRELVAATRRVASGDLGVRAAPSDIEEVGDLARAFNEMSATIATTQSALSARLRESAALVAIAKVVGGTPDLTEALRQIARELARLTGADTAAAFLLADDRQTLLPVAAYHVPKDALDEFSQTQLPVNELRLPPALFEGGRVVWTTDVQGDPRFDGFIFRKFAHQSGAIVPLVLDGQAWGGFYLMWWTLERALQDDELALLQGISEEAGVLVRTVRLYQEAEARRRIAEAAKERYRLLFDRNLAGVFRTVRDGRVIECNEAFARMMGYHSRDEVLARHAQDFYADPSDRARFLARIDEDRRVTNLELHLRRANGTTFWALINATKVNDGTGEYLEGVTIDIGDRKHAEEAERRVATLNSVAALANAAAHEINNPLAVLVGHLDIEMGRTWDPQTRERLAKARAAAQRIREIVAQMHNVTRLEIAPDPPGLPDRLDFGRSSD